MPLFKMKCNCGHAIRRIAPSQPILLCPACGSKMVRDASPPSSQLKSARDNGLMERRVETPDNIKDLLKERDAATKVKKD